MITAANPEEVDAVRERVRRHVEWMQARAAGARAPAEAPAAPAE